MSADLTALSQALTARYGSANWRIVGNEIHVRGNVPTAPHLGWWVYGRVTSETVARGAVESVGR